MPYFGKFYNGVLTVNSYDLSSLVQSAKLILGKEVFDLTVFGNAAKVRAAVGLEDHSLPVSFIEDVGSNKVFQTLLAMWQSGVGVPITFKLDSGTTAPGNPLFSCSYVLSGGQLPIGGQHGQLLKTDVTFVSAGVITITTA